MNIEELRDYCISKQGVDESFPFGKETLVFKVNGKIFLITRIYSDPLTFSVKCDPDKAIELREQYDCVKPGYHLNKKHWNTITVDRSLSNKQLKEMIDLSYSLVAKRKK